MNEMKANSQNSLVGIRSLDADEIKYVGGGESGDYVAYLACETVVDDQGNYTKTCVEHPGPDAPTPNDNDTPCPDNGDTCIA